VVVHKIRPTDRKYKLQTLKNPENAVYNIAGAVEMHINSY